MAVIRAAIFLTGCLGWISALGCGMALAQDAGRGATVFADNCGAFHNDTQGAGIKIGPNLFGVVGAAAGLRAEARADSSDALKNSGVVWSAQTLDALLSGPARDCIAGITMAFEGLADAQDRADLIAYLVSISPQPDPTPM